MYVYVCICICLYIYMYVYVSVCTACSQTPKLLSKLDGPRPALFNTEPLNRQALFILSPKSAQPY